MNTYRERLLSAACVRFMLMGIFSGQSLLFHAAVLHVDMHHATPPYTGTALEPFPSIQSAIDMAQDGDEIRIAVGEYRENLVVSNKSLHLSGAWSGGSERDYDPTGPGGVFDATNETGLWTHITGDPAAPVLFLEGESTSGTVIERFRLSGGLHGISMEDWPPLTDLVIRENWIEGNGHPETERGMLDGGGIQLTGERIRIENNIIEKNQGGIGGGLECNILEMAFIGNSIIGNIGHSDHAGGASLTGSGRVEGNLFADNRVGEGVGYGWGGGIALFGLPGIEGNFRFVMTDNEIRGNHAPTAGGGLFVDEAAVADIRHALIHHNTVDENGNGGAGIYVDGAGNELEGEFSIANIDFCTIADNTGRSGNAGNGVLVEFSHVKITNSIFWGNLDDFSFNEQGSFEVRYCLAEELVAGEGNLSGNPRFVGGESRDYHLSSRLGHWDDAAATWVADLIHSPGIDAASPEAPFTSEPAPNGQRANMGFYGNTNEASLTDVNNHAPSDISLLPSTIPENLTPGTIVGNLTVNDEDEGDDVVFSFVSGEGDADNDVFELRENQLFALDEFDFETRSTYSIRVQANDLRGGIHSKALVISVLDVEEGNYLRRWLQQDADDYQGVKDTYISTEDWDTPPQYQRNYGQSETLLLSRDGGDNVLIEFDLSSIPSNSDIQEARLELFNTTLSRISGLDAPERRITAHAVLRGWLEGSQNNEPLTSAGENGATGDYAVFHVDHPSETVSWSERGMRVDADFEATILDTAAVAGPGWARWNVLDVVREWVSGKRQNFGITLRDATSYDERQDDSRAFLSSQHLEQVALRPRLLVVYNPLTPKADAGVDRFLADWSGDSVDLDASSSRTQDGVSTDGLHYRWSILKPAWGSRMQGVVSEGANPVVAFQADVAGDWVFELEVTNSEGESARDEVQYRLWSVERPHPRIHVTPGRLQELRSRAEADDRRWLQLIQWLDRTVESQWDRIALARGNALRWLVTEDPIFGRRAIEMALREMAQPGIAPTEPGDLALVYDWCHELLTVEERGEFHDMFVAFATAEADGEDISGWTNYWTRFGYSFGMMGLAAYGDHPDARQWMEEFRDRRYEQVDQGVLNRIAEGGGWPEGRVYDWIANPSRILMIHGWQTATGEQLFLSSDWFQERLNFFLMNGLPGVAQQFSITYHPYLATGDSERGRGSVAVMQRMMSLILHEQFPDHPSAAALNGYLMAGDTANMDQDHFMEEFLWSHPDWPQSVPDIRVQYAEPLGSVWMRSDWRDGAADTDKAVTYASFQCGDHFSYHQHSEQNSFTIHKGAPLLIDSGVYSGEALSSHDINYYMRTIAHNTLVVYNPDETFDRLRDGVMSNDGGQRDFHPAPRTPTSVEQHHLNTDSYETGDILRFESNNRMTYVTGDATRAYNSTDYYQAAVSDDRPGNVAKLRQYRREFVYLRPEDSGEAEYVVVYDRVGVTAPEFSGENTKLLFHFLEEPNLDVEGQLLTPGELLHHRARQLTVRSGNARLDMDFLFPEQRNVRKVGGRGVKDFWVFDQNYNWHWSEEEASLGPVTDFEPEPYGEWRVELEPADDALDHTFLTVLRPTEDGEKQRITVLAAGDTWGESALIRGSNEEVLVSFARSEDGWRRFVPNRIDLPVELGTKPLRFYVFNCQPHAKYSFETNISGGGTRISMVENQDGSFDSSSQGVLSGVLFDPQSGRETFTDWVRRWLSEGSVSDPSIATHDSDGDGLSNLVEFVWKLDPVQTDDELPEVARLSLDSDRSVWSLTASIPSVARLDVELVLEWSDDLGSWHADGLPSADVEVLTDGTLETIFSHRALYRWPILRADVMTGTRYYRLAYRLLTP